MRMKSLLVAAAAAIGCSAFAYTWTGGGNDGLWTTPANWGVASGYPQTASDPVVFTGDATVSLNTGSLTDIAYKGEWGQCRSHGDSRIVAPDQLAGLPESEQQHYRRSRHHRRKGCLA